MVISINAKRKKHLAFVAPFQIIIYLSKLGLARN